MQTINDFMGEFLRAEQELRRRSVDLERDLWARFGLNGFCFSETVRDGRSYEPGKLEDIQESEENVTVTATVVSPSYDLTRARYTLFQVKADWRIAGVGYFCRICAGSGRTVSPKEPGTVKVCSICEGLGYFVPANLKVPHPTIAPSLESMRSGKADLDQFMHTFLVAERALVARQLGLANETWSSFAVPQLRRPLVAALKRQWDDQTMVHTFHETTEGAVVIATVVRSWQSEGRVRYTVSRRGGAWWLSGLEFACPNCNGRGSYLIEKEGTTSELGCLVCRGKAWFPFDDSKTESAG